MKIILSKYIAFYSSGTPQEKINNLTSISEIRCTTSLYKYSSFPILKEYRPKKNDFNFIIEKMQTTLATWKNRLIKKSGRLAIASSVLSAIPSYYIQINYLPQRIYDSIEKTTRNFIWMDSNNKGIHLVDSRKISRPKNLGGLGIRSARETNICHLGKLIWDLVQSSNKLWVHLFSNKYLWIMACFKQNPLGAALLNGPPSSVLKMCLKMVTNGALAVVLPHFGSLTRVV